jgi:hypothetical protein
MTSTYIRQRLFEAKQMLALETSAAHKEVLQKIIILYQAALKLDEKDEAEKAMNAWGREMLEDFSDI